MSKIHPNDGTILRQGDRAKEFTLQDTGGMNVSLSDVLLRGPAIVVFYRGDW